MADYDKVDVTKQKLSQLGEVLNIGAIDMKHIGELEVSTDPYDQIVLEALKINKDHLYPLHVHQYRALYALSKGKDVLLISPCGSGKTRSLINGLHASRKIRKELIYFAFQYLS